MKIVIEIPDFRWLENEGDFKEAVKEYEQGSRFDKEIRGALLNGTPLPEHHGRLGDLDDLEAEMINGIKAGNYEEGYEKYQNINNIDDCVECVHFADTIIEGSESK